MSQAKERSDYTSIEEGEKYENKVTGVSGYAALQSDKALYAMTDERGVTQGKNQVYQDAEFQANMERSLRERLTDTSFLRDEGGKNLLQGADFMAAIAESRARGFTMSQGMVDSQGRHLNATFDKSGNVKKLSSDGQFSYSDGGKMDMGAEFQAAWQAYALGKDPDKLNMQDFVKWVGDSQTEEAHRKNILGHLTAKIVDVTGMEPEAASAMVMGVGAGLGTLAVNKMIGDPLGALKNKLAGKNPKADQQSPNSVDGKYGNNAQNGTNQQVHNGTSLDDIENSRNEAKATLSENITQSEEKVNSANAQLAENGKRVREINADSTLSKEQKREKIQEIGKENVQLQAEIKDAQAQKVKVQAEISEIDKRYDAHKAQLEAKIAGETPKVSPYAALDKQRDDLTKEHGELNNERKALAEEKARLEEQAKGSTEGSKLHNEAKARIAEIDAQDEKLAKTQKRIEGDLREICAQKENLARDLYEDEKAEAKAQKDAEKKQNRKNRLKGGTWRSVFFGGVQTHKIIAIDHNITVEVP